MKVSELMASPVHVCGVYENLNEAVRRMWEEDCGCLPVVNGSDEVVGMLTDRDACMAAYTQGRLLRDIPVSSAMSGHVQTCRDEDTVETAEALMKEHQIRRLPVLGKDGRLVGVISLGDIALEFKLEQKTKKRKVDAKQVAETLAAICAHQNGARRGGRGGLARGAPKTFGLGGDARGKLTPQFSSPAPCRARTASSESWPRRRWPQPPSAPARMTERARTRPPSGRTP